MEKLSVDAAVETAILVVNGGQDPVGGRWLKLCVDKIVEHTRPGTYRLYVWNNNTEDTLVANYLERLAGCQLVQSPSGLKLKHVHADPLQRLYEIAKADGAKYIVTMDSDAHPIRKGWLDTLVDELRSGAALAGAWRDELSSAIDPYIHASCLATTVDFIESEGLRLDHIPSNDQGIIHDTLSEFTRRAQTGDRRIFRWRRSNKRQFHRLIGGVYGDSVYHHGAGSRAAISFWDEKPTKQSAECHWRTGQIGADLLLNEYEDYVAWLRGEATSSTCSEKLERLKEGKFAESGYLSLRESTGSRRLGLGMATKQEVIMNPIDLVRLIKQDKPKLLGIVPDDLAARIIRAAFDQIRAEIDSIDEGVLPIAALGRFKVRAAKDMAVDGSPVMAKRIIFKPAKVNADRDADV